MENTNEMTELTVKQKQDQILAKITMGAMQESEDIEARREIAEGLYRLGKVHYDKADLKTAEKYFSKALEKSIYPRDSFAMFKCYGFLIRIYSEQLKVEKAEKYILEAQKLVESFQSELGSLNGDYFYNVGMVFTYKGEFEKSLESFKLSYQKAQTENEPELMAKALFAKANSCFNLEDYDQALSFCNQLKELLTILKKEYLEGSMYMLLGNIYKELGQPANANSAFDMAIQLLQRKNCWNLFGYILLGKGIVSKRAGEFNQALLYFRIAKNAANNEYKRLAELIDDQVEDVNDSSVDLYLDRHNRVIHEKDLGSIDFKHRFVLLEILFLLAKSPGESFNKEDLAKSIWKDEYNPLIHDKLIYTSISRLRKLIEPKGGKRKYILRGKDGYTFNPRVNARFHKESTYTKRVIGNVDMNSPV